jgi:ubiquinone/menaquinone biosynthesis C-methylase UbiE
MTLNRWRKAQKYERLYWMKTAEKIVAGSTGQLGWYEWKYNEMEKHLLPFIDRERYDLYRIIEIGCGPIGIIKYINRGRRYGLDPLEEFYKSNETLTQLRDSRVQYLEGTGEQIPFEENFFDLVISDNVLDHVYDTNLVMREIFRVLKPGGYLYLIVNVRTRRGTQFHKILSKLLIDKGHPQSFDVTSIRNLIGRFQYSLLSEWISNSREARSRDIHSPSIKDKAKGYTGLSEFLYCTVCRKI